GEMSPDEASAFEESMAEDLHACEAVARAVRLTQGLQRAIPCVRPIVAASPAASRPLRGRWGTVASAAGVLVIAGILLSRGVGESPTERPVTVERDSHVRDAQPDAESLIALWTQTRGDWRTELA